MSRDYELTELAEQDIFEIIDYITLSRGDEATQRFLDTLTEKFQLLLNSPRLGRTRDELTPELRSFAFGSYVIFYRPIEDGILIVRVLHGARDITSIFEAEQDG